MSAARGQRVVVWRGGKPVRRIENRYDAATIGTGRTAQWIDPATGPNESLSPYLHTLRNRSRGAVRNNPWIFQAIDRLVSNEVGVGVTLRAASGKKRFNKAMDELWRDHRDRLDFYGTAPFGGLQSAAVRARRVAGEVFIRRRRLKANAPFPLPFKIQLLESELVPLTLNQDTNRGGRIRQGIEFDRFGQRVAYWMHKRHPTDDEVNWTASDFVRVPARDVIHHFDPTIRPGQIRGEPNSVRSLLPARTFDSYEDAELVRKETRAPFTGAVTRKEFDEGDFLFDPFTGEPVEGAEGPSIVNATPGTFLQTYPGEAIDLFDGDNTGQGFLDYSMSVLRKIAAGYGMPYEMVSGDWSKVNDRLVRAITNEFRRHIQAAQDHFLIFQVCRGIWIWAVEAAILSGRVRATDYHLKPDEYHRVIARPHAWEYTHPEQDVNTKIKLLEKKLTSRKAIIDSMPGPSMEEIDKQIEEDAQQSVYSTDTGNNAQSDSGDDSQSDSGDDTEEETKK